MQCAQSDKGVKFTKKLEYNDKKNADTINSICLASKRKFLFNLK